MPKHLLLISSRGFPGSYKVLINLKGVLRNVVETNIIPIERLSFLPTLADGQLLRKPLEKIKIELHLININKIVEYGNNILFAGWGPIYEVALKKLNKRGITPSLIMCSTPGQSELSKCELISYHNIVEHVKTGKIKCWLLNKRLYNSIGRLITQSTYFPHTIDLEQFNKVLPKNLPGENIDLFSPIRAGKNILNQIIGFKISGVSATLHINFRDKLLNLLIKDIDANIARHNWIEHSEYYNLVAAMDLSLQATFTESFSYAVAERMCLGVPVITSHDIYFTAENDFLSKNLCVQSLDTPSEIARTIKRIFEDKKLLHSLGKRCRGVIKGIADKNNKEARDFIIDFLQ